MEKKNTMMIVIIVLLLVLLGTIVGVSVFVFNFMNERSDVETVEQVRYAVKLTPDQLEYVTLDEPITTNLLKGSDGKDHSIRVSVLVELDNSESKDKKENEAKAEFIEMFQTKLSVVRAIAVEIIREKTYQDMSRPDAGAILSEEILIRLQDEFESSNIVNVRITDIFTN